MSEPAIRLLTDIPIETIHDAFVDAFSEYEIRLEMPVEKFREMILTRDIKSNYSMGYFDKNRLVGFILTGYRKIDEKKNAYDGGSGSSKRFVEKELAKSYSND